MPHTKSLEILCKNAEENIIVGGNLKPLYEVKPPKWFDEKIGYLVGIGNIYYGIPYGACMLIGKKLFNQIGYFRPELGRMKGSLVGIEDYEFVIRAKRYGFKSKIVQNAVFLHFVPRYRLELKYFIKRALADGASHLLIDMIYAKEKIIFKTLRYIFTLPSLLLKFYFLKTEISVFIEIMRRIGYLYAILTNIYRRRLLNH